jgi:hypothetical protein
MEDARDGRFKGLLAPVCTKNKYTIEKKVCRPTGNFIAHNHTRINIFILARSLVFAFVHLTGVSRMHTELKQIRNLVFFFYNNKTILLV